jgi:tight adherence protein B
MGFIFANDIILIPLVGISVFIFCYFSCDRILDYLQRRSLGSREEVLALMDKMFIETDRKKVTWSMLACSFGPALLFFAAVWPHVLAGLIFGSVLMILGWSAPKALITSMFEKRCNRLVNQMVDGMTIMSNGIKAGQSLTQSMERVVENLSGPLPQEFSLILNKIRLGMSVEEAMIEFSERVPKQDVQMFVTAVNILKETGGNLAETFQTITSTVRERQKVEQKIQALTAMGNTQAVIVSLVPVALLGLFLVVDPNYVMPLFNRALGWVALAIMVVLQVIGLVVMRKIVNIKV